MTRRTPGEQGQQNHQLRQQREARGWSQRQVAEQIGTNNVTVSRWERGTIKPSKYFRTRLCDLFALSEQELGLTAQEEPGARVNEEIPLHSLSLQVPLEPFVYDPAIPLLPMEARGLVGRDALMYALKEQLITYKHLAISALNGLPGVGKTALACQLVRDQGIQAHFYDGILWAAMGQSPNLPALLGRWAVLLNVAADEITRLTNMNEWATTLRDVIGMRRMLLVIDDAWRIEDAMAMKVGGPNCAYLLTTRFPLLAMEFAGRHATNVQELDEGNGVALLARFAASVVEQEPEMARELVRVAGGLPLALTLMGKYLRLQAHSRQPRRILAALNRLKDVRERLALAQPNTLTERSLSIASGTTPSLRGVIALSDQHLPPQAQAALRACALFPPKPNTFSEEAALAASGTPLEILDTLTDVGLLEASGEKRYTLHQTIADYARLDPPDPGAQQRLVDYFVTYIEAHQQDYTSLEREANNIQTALDLASHHNLSHSLVRGVLALVLFWEARGLYVLAETYLERARVYAHAIQDDLLLARIVLLLGRVAERRGEPTQAEQQYEESLDLARMYIFRKGD